MQSEFCMTEFQFLTVQEQQEPSISHMFQYAWYIGMGSNKKLE